MFASSLDNRGVTVSHQANAGAVLYVKNLPQVSAFYSGVAGLDRTQVDEDYVVLDSPMFQLVVVAMPAEIAATIKVANPPARRTDTPIKLFFQVASIGAARAAATRLGGELNPADREWDFLEYRICDGHDPEGNVVQFRESR